MSSGTGSTRNCVSCGRAIGWDANVCPYCGHDFRVSPQAAQKKDSAMPVVGGVLIIIPAIGYLILGGLMVAGGAVWGEFDFMGEGEAAMACGAVVVVLGLIAVLGGIFAIMKKNFWLALLGGIFVVPTLLGLVGLILIAIGKDSFD